MRVRISVLMASALVLGVSMTAYAVVGNTVTVTGTSPFSLGCEQTTTAGA